MVSADYDPNDPVRQHYGERVIEAMFQFPEVVNLGHEQDPVQNGPFDPEPLLGKDSIFETAMRHCRSLSPNSSQRHHGTYL